MDQRKKLEIQIEQLRVKMYQAYEDGAGNENVLKISQQLDQLLNELEMLEQRK